MKLLSLLLGGASPRVHLHLRVMDALRRRGMKRLGRLVAARLQRKHGVFVSSKAVVPTSVELKHPVGIVIGDGVRLGERVVIYQNVTLGGARVGDWTSDNYPEVGDDSVIFAGAVVVGKIKIGKRCVIGANAVVTRDVPDGATAVGVPARII
ncbi:serine O-acetyltransferase [Stenotrophomonas rhizophila]|uniref:serine O-acetyltransferase n=1 Tax=Stenotrophomonas rhizophila TaxID=216778 RepID=UPI00339B7389